MKRGVRGDMEEVKALGNDGLSLPQRHFLKGEKMFLQITNLADTYQELSADSYL